MSENLVILVANFGKSSHSTANADKQKQILKTFFENTLGTKPDLILAQEVLSGSTSTDFDYVTDPLKEKTNEVYVPLSIEEYQDRYNVIFLNTAKEFRVVLAMAFKLLGSCEQERF